MFVQREKDGFNFQVAVTTLQLYGHGVEGPRELRELVAAPGIDPVIEVPSPDRGGAVA